MSYLNKGTVSFDDNATIDAFGRLRVSNPETLFDSKQLHDKQPQYYDEVLNGTATAVHSSPNAETIMSVAANGDYAIRQTKQRFNYQPGKSQLILCTFTLGTQTANVTKRVGYFNSNTTAPYTGGFDGLYLEDDGSTFNLCQSKSGTTTSVARSSWNDPMDGTGPSGRTIDFTKSQILYIDFEWLGVGRVRMGFVIDGKIYYVYSFNNANNVTSVYATSPNHSIRYEIRSSGGSSSMAHICSSVMSEGGAQRTGTVRSTNTGSTAVDANTSGTRYALIGMRLKTSHLDINIAVEGVSVMSSTTSNFAWEVYLNPTVAGTFTYNDQTNSASQIALGDNANDPSTSTVTGGTLIASGLVSNNQDSVQSSIPSNLRIGAKIDGTQDEVVLCAYHFTGTEDYYGAITWREFL